jgi:hypothetical protein
LTGNSLFVVHRLLIEVDYSSIGDQYSELLQKWEMPRGSTIMLAYYVTNLSDFSFSGKIIDMSTSFNETALGPTSMLRENRQLIIRALPRGHRIMFYQTNVRMYSEGKGWFRVVMVADDGQQIEYFSSTDGPGTSQWQSGFDVINREQLEIIKLLKEISAKLQ